MKKVRLSCVQSYAWVCSIPWLGVKVKQRPFMRNCWILHNIAEKALEERRLIIPHLDCNVIDNIFEKMWANQPMHIDIDDRLPR